MGVESICTVLAELGASLAPSTDDNARRALAAEPTAAARCDEWLAAEMARVHARTTASTGATVLDGAGLTARETSSGTRRRR